jgi:hypothetical protein
MPHLPQPGDYGLVRTYDAMGWLIRLGTLSKWNHAFVYLGDGLIAEAAPKGVIISPASNYPDAVYSNDNLDAIDRNLIVKAAKSYVGTPYNWVDIVAIVCVRVLGFKLKRAMARVARMDRMICSQHVAQSYADARYDLHIGWPPFLVEPADLANRLIEEA